ncbi:hypothetical protein ACLB2K_046336 [Fragaria x ananassa]
MPPTPGYRVKVSQKFYFVPPHDLFPARDVTGRNRYYGRVANVTSPDLVEAYAGRLACEMARELQLFPIVLESDCLNLVKATQSDMEDSAFGMIVEDIKQDSLSLNSSFFSHVFRESNLVAHKLARLALSCSSPSRWVGAPPGELQGLLASPPCNR